MRTTRDISTQVRTWVLAGTAVLGVLATAGCQQSPESAAPRPQGKEASPSAVTPSPSKQVPSPVERAKQRAKRAYVGMWQAMARAGHTSDWQSSELGRYATSHALTTITRSLYADHFNNVVTRGAPKNHPTVTSVEPPKAPTKTMIKDCGDSSGWLKYYEGTDDLVDESGGGRRSIVAEVKKQPDGSWKVTRFAVRGLGTC